MEKMNIGNFAKQAGVSRQTVYDWIERGFLEPKLFGKRPYFEQDDLAQVISIRKTLKENQHRF